MNLSELHGLILSNAGVITLRFRKKLQPAQIAARLWDSTGQDFAGFKKAVLQELAGEPRTIVCSHEGEYDTFGRLKVRDVENDGPRLIDMRTIEWAVIDGVKHEVV